MSATTIRISEKTRDRLAKYGKFGESYDTLINRVLDNIKDTDVGN